ncbi:MAG: CRISPR-associated DxTHG motif protein [Arcobacteraceae bacterium]
MQKHSGLRIVKKVNNKPISEKSSMNKPTKKAVITVLGLVGGDDKHQKANYYFEDSTKEIQEHYNTLTLLIGEYSKEYKIVPIYTKEAKEANTIALNKSRVEFTYFDDIYLIKDDKDFEGVFNIINNAVSSYDELIIDVSHGFRHIPILMIVDLIIQNFQDTSKIKKILYAKEIEQFKEYEIIDLKKYLDLANITFILTTFTQNYTVANHIKSDKYSKLVEKLNSFSNDLMALSLNNLFKKTSQELIKELENTVKEPELRDLANKLIEHINNITSYKDKKRYETYYNLSRDLYDKKYILLSLSLLFESIRMYIRSSIEKNHPEIVTDIEMQLNKDRYKIGDFFKNLAWKGYEDLSKISISESNYKVLQKSYDGLNISNLYNSIDKTRNNLAHANSDNKTFKDIEHEVGELLNKYYEKCIKQNP